MAPPFCPVATIDATVREHRVMLETVVEGGGAGSLALWMMTTVIQVTVKILLLM